MPKHGKHKNGNKKVKYDTPEKIINALLKAPNSEKCLSLKEKLEQISNSMLYECASKCIEARIDISTLLQRNIDQVTTVDKIKDLNGEIESINDKIKKINTRSNELTSDIKEKINTIKNKCLSEAKAFKEKLEKKENELKEKKVVQKKELQQKSNTDDVINQIQSREKETGAKGKEHRERRNRKDIKVTQEVLNKASKQYEKNIDIVTSMRKAFSDTLHGLQEYANGNQSEAQFKKVDTQVKVMESKINYFLKRSGLEKELSLKEIKEAIKLNAGEKQDLQKTMNYLDNEIIKWMLIVQRMDCNINSCKEQALKMLTQPNSKIEDCTCEGACACNKKSHQ